MTMSSIGLAKEDLLKLAPELNVLLANYQILYMNTRGYHWNITGPQFFQLHIKFEEMYNDLLLKVDEIAERVLTLEAQPLHTFSDYLVHAEIKEHKNVHDAKACVDGLLSGLQTLLIRQRKILSMAAEAGDEGTVALMSDYIQQQEKTVWMLCSFRHV
ncbi:MAG: Dps family protein [Plesiomonas sp.]